MLSQFFIDRPRFALVISLLITIAGAISYLTLPVAQFPALTPPTVTVTTTYAGANSAVVADTVTSVIESEINGVADMLYMTSVSSNDGASSITVYFKVGTDVDLAAVQVQNRAARATPRLPQSVQREGIKVEAASPDMLVVVNLKSNDPELDELFLSNYATINIKDALLRVDGVGRINMFGARDYGMRVWVDPDRLRAFDLSTTDLVNAIRDQNAQIAGGRVGSAPNLPSQRFQLSVILRGRLTTPKQFEEIILRANPDGSIIRLKDVARIELGAQNYDIAAKLNGGPTSALILYQTPGSNALDAAQTVKAEMERLSKSFPKGLEYQITYDSTRFIEVSIDEMMVTLYEAVGLVVLVVFIFLAALRPTLVPAVAVPVSLIGTFALMSGVGFSINTLSLFGLILAIGIVVDDAILVVETTTRNIEEKGMQPKEATSAAMQEVSGAVIASSLVLAAVFVPVAFIPGLTGRLFQQFALTITAAVVISTVNALSLSPALCALILRPPGEKPSFIKRGFDRVFNPTRDGYVRVAAWTLRHKALTMLLFVGLLAGTVMAFKTAPTGFLPNEDDGVIMAQVMLPNAASLNRTAAVTDRIAEIAKAEPDVENVMTFAGYSLLAGAAASNSAFMILTLKDWEHRKGKEHLLSSVLARLNAKFYGIAEASVFAFQQPPIRGLGMTAGFDFQLQDRGAVGPETMGEITNDLIAAAEQHPSIAKAVSTYRADVPRVYIDFNFEQAQSMGVSLSNIGETLSSTLGARYVDDLVLYGKTFRVMMEAEKQAVLHPEDLLKLSVINDEGGLVPLSAIASLKPQVGPEYINRFNLYNSALITVMPAPGASSSEAMDAMQEIAAQLLPKEMGYEWSGSAREQMEAQGASTIVFALSIVFVFLFLVAQYESFSIPLSVLLIIPLAAMGAVVAQLIAHLPVDLYTQVGLVLLVGTTAKTAILLVELSKQQVEAGADVESAATDAAHLRFRAVLMTALTFVLGMVPMVTASGAGAASRISLGTAVIGGTIAGVVFTLVLVPMFFVLIQNARTHFKGGTSPPGTPPPPTENAAEVT